MNNERPTPETDAFAIKFKTTCGEKYWVPVDFSRKLERERDEAADQIETLMKQNAELNRQLTNEQKNYYALASHHNQHCTCMEIY